MKRLIALSAFAVCLAACGGNTVTPTQPTTPSQPQPQPQANRAPTVSATVSPAFGIHGLTTFTMTVGSMTGTWRGTGPAALGNFSLTLVQENTGRVTGSYSDSTFGAGQLDAASTTNRIDGQGAIEMRVKQGPFNDWTFRGQMDQTGRRITGGVFGSGFSGQPFTLTKD